ncbi:MAG: deoxyribose-phosphate aldolase [Tepidisphaeraceae bacterium]|jgi:deoxyribose-phosphate aldolase
MACVFVFFSAMDCHDLARCIDHTMLKPEALAADIDKVVAEARQHGFASVCVAPAWVRHVAGALQGCGVAACTVIGFPHGTSKAVVKAIEATSATKDGAAEIDVVAFLPNLLNHDLDAARAELIEVVKAARSTRRDVVIKVIVESAALMVPGETRGERSIEIACRAVRESGCDFIKTSTGFHPAGGATVHAIGLMRKYGHDIKIKASGGIRDLKTAQAMLAAGASRLGLSASVAILREHFS